MPGRASQVHQATATLKVGEVVAQAETVRAHVRRIIESPALKGSKRSQEFLQFVVDRALDGHCEELKERTCGVWVVDIQRGQVVAFLKFEEAVQEIFAVVLLPGMRFPDLINDNTELVGSSFVLPDDALRDVPADLRAQR